MTHYLAGTRLKADIQTLIETTGPRPAGHPAEGQARQWVEARLRESDIQDVESIDYVTPDTWGWGTIVPTIIALVGMFFVPHPLFSSFLVLLAAHQFLLATVARLNDHLLYFLYPKRPSATLLARIPPTGDVWKRVVLIGHLDTNKHRASFAPHLKKHLRLSSTILLGSMVAYAIANLLAWDIVRYVTILYAAIALMTLLLDEKDGYVDGANDNGSAVACVLGIGRQAQAAPFRHTEVWLAFPGEEEVTHNGLKALLKQSGETLRSAQFIDFEMVGKGHPLRHPAKRADRVFGVLPRCCKPGAGRSDRQTIGGFVPGQRA
ncbi:MAG: M28 family peptidase [Anaerolineaceae bacterium]|nr:M28 family peptidase [Anaerolineaceae bacterium]